MYERLLSRKFLLSVVILISGVVFLLTGQIDYPQFLSLSKWILGIYVVGNVGAKTAFAIPGIVKK